LPIYDLAAGELKLQMKSSAKDEEKKKEAGHYSGLSMRTKRSKIASSDAAPQICALLHTRNTALLHLNDANTLPDNLSPASHQFWGQRN